MIVYKVSLGYFSGRRSPEWIVDSTTNAALWQQIENAPKDEESPAKLGYSGFTLIPKEDNKAPDYEAHFHFYGPDSKALQMAILDSAPPDQVGDCLRQKIQQIIERQ